MPQSPFRKTGPAAALALLIALIPAPSFAQNYPPPPGAAPPPPPAQGAAVFAPQQLDQLLAPVALYPDALLAQVLMAATYPLDVVAADRWLQDPGNASLRGDALAAALDQQPWDPSVKSLVPFPQVVKMMDSRLDWMQRLGDAFLAQPDDVMASVQRLRAAARAAGNLASTPQENVEVQGQTIVIVPANPQVVYVPEYEPAVVYGVWPYPDYPPYYILPPPGYVVSGFFFGVGISVLDLYWGWDDFDWGRRRIRIDPDRFNRINRGRPPVTGDSWRHDPSRRGAVPYRDPASRAQYQRPAPAPGPEARQNYRGYAPGQNAPAQQAARPAQPQQQARPVQPQAQPQARPAQPQQQQTRAAQPQAQPFSRPAAPQPQVTRPAPQSTFQPAARGPEAHAYSQRGAESRQAPVAAPQRSAPAPASRGSAPAQGGGHQGGGQQGGGQQGGGQHR